MLQHETTNKISNLQATIQQAEANGEDMRRYLADDALEQFIETYNKVINSFETGAIEEETMHRLDNEASYFTDDHEPALYTNVSQEDTEKGRYQIDIWDNGPGMSRDTFEENLDNQPKSGIGR